MSPTPTTAPALVIAADDLGTDRNRLKVRKAIDERRPVRIEVRGPAALVLSVALAQHAADGAAPASSDGDTGRTPREIALAEAKKQALYKSRRKKAFAEAKEKALQASRRRTGLSEAKRKALDAANIKALDEAEKKAESESLALAKALAEAEDKARAAERKRVADGTEDPAADPVLVQPMAFVVDDVILLSVAGILAAVAVAGLVAVSVIALEGIKAGYGIQIKNDTEFAVLEFIELVTGIDMVLVPPLEDD